MSNNIDTKCSCVSILFDINKKSFSLHLKVGVLPPANSEIKNIGTFIALYKEMKGRN